jgi:hypothetical protein
MQRVLNDLPTASAREIQPQFDMRYIAQLPDEGLGTVEQDRRHTIVSDSQELVNDYLKTQAPVFLDIQNYIRNLNIEDLPDTNLKRLYAICYDFEGGNNFYTRDIENCRRTCLLIIRMHWKNQLFVEERLYLMKRR